MYVYFHYICDCRESAEYNVIELVHTVQVPVSMCKFPYCPYKYCVFSKPVEECMESPFEFIAGHDWSRTAKIINRLLRLLETNIAKESK